MVLNQLLSYKSRNPDKPRILLLARTGIAGINIGDSTIHTALGIGIGSKLVPLSNKKKVKLCEKFSEIELIIIDEISMVSNELFFQLNQRLIDIFRCGSNKPFAGIQMILRGDLYQLPPVRGKPVFMSNLISCLIS